MVSDANCAYTKEMSTTAEVDPSEVSELEPAHAERHARCRSRSSQHEPAHGSYRHEKPGLAYLIAPPSRLNRLRAGKWRPGELCAVLLSTVFIPCCFPRLVASARSPPALWRRSRQGLGQWLAQVTAARRCRQSARSAVGSTGCVCLAVSSFADPEKGPRRAETETEGVHGDSVLNAASGAGAVFFVALFGGARTWAKATNLETIRGLPGQGVWSCAGCIYFCRVRIVFDARRPLRVRAGRFGRFGRFRPRLLQDAWRPVADSANVIISKVPWTVKLKVLVRAKGVPCRSGRMECGAAMVGERGGRQQQGPRLGSRDGGRGCVRTPGPQLGTGIAGVWPGRSFCESRCQGSDSLPEASYM